MILDEFNDIDLDLMYDYWRIIIIYLFILLSK
jgi:hypothetical protein